MSDSERAVKHEQASPGAPAPGEGPAQPGRPQPGRGEDRADSGNGRAGTAPEAAAPPAQQDGGGAKEVEGDLDELVRIAAQRDEYLALAQRTQADFENYRKRVAREAAAAQERGVIALAKELLPAFDNLDRALAAAAEDDPLLEGVQLVRAELAAALSRAGIDCYSPVGEQFDPSLHEAVATAPRPDGGASGVVLEVYQAGYRLGANIIRPARVVVAA